MQQEPVFRMYSSRWQALFPALIGSLFLLVGVGMVLDPRTRYSGEAVKDVVAGVFCILMGSAAALYGYYYVLTPIPVLRVDSTGMTYRGPPFAIRRVRWDDVDSLRAVKCAPFRRGILDKNPALTVYITLNPHAFTVRGKGMLYWRFDPADLTKAPEEVVEHIRRFHAVDYDDQFTQSKQVRSLSPRRRR
jgi:hypothetical protein